MTLPAGARFDDLVSGTALSCPPPRRVLTARRPEDVVRVLAEVDRVTRGGSWAFGYVSYEAAAGLDPTLAVASRRPARRRRPGLVNSLRGWRSAVLLPSAAS